MKLPFLRVAIGQRDLIPAGVIGPEHGVVRAIHRLCQFTALIPELARDLVRGVGAGDIAIVLVVSEPRGALERVGGTDQSLRRIVREDRRLLQRIEGARQPVAPVINVGGCGPVR